VAPRPRWWHQLQASKGEAGLAVDLYNRVGSERRLEAYVVHMTMAWLKALQARWERDGRDLYVRDERGWRQRGQHGEFIMYPLSRMLRSEFSEQDPVRKNIEFFLGLRNRIEHRYDTDTALLVAGKTEALMLNYERYITDKFGAGEGLAGELRFPIFISSITGDAVAAIKEVRKRVPLSVKTYIERFEADLDGEMAEDARYEFRITLIPQTGPKTTADTAITFVRLDELTPEQREEVERVQAIVRDKQLPVTDYGFLPKEVVTEVGQRLDIRFTMTDHTHCWQYYKVRPPYKDPHPDRTNADFCIYSKAFGRYTFTPAWIDKLTRDLADPEKHEAILGREPEPA
jgi:hypothetical protein